MATTGTCSIAATAPDSNPKELYVYGTAPNNLVIQWSVSRPNSFDLLISSAPIFEMATLDPLLIGLNGGNILLKVLKSVELESFC